MVDETITAANTINDRPVVVEFIIRTDAMVWPMAVSYTHLTLPTICSV